MTLGCQQGDAGNIKSSRRSFGFPGGCNRQFLCLLYLNKNFRHVPIGCPCVLQNVYRVEPTAVLWILPGESCSGIPGAISGMLHHDPPKEGLVFLPDPDHGRSPVALCLLGADGGTGLPKSLQDGPRSPRDTICRPGMCSIRWGPLSREKSQNGTGSCWLPAIGPAWKWLMPRGSAALLSAAFLPVSSVIRRKQQHRWRWGLSGSI